MATARTVTQLLQSALKVLGVYAPGETPAAEDLATAKMALQDLLAEWSDGGLVVPSIVWEAITLVVDQNSYTVGENGSPDLSTVRPEQIIGAFVRDSSNYDYPVTIIGERAYRVITAKSGSSGRPDKLWYNPTAPNGTIYVYLKPSSTDSLYICSIKPFKEPSSLTESLLNTTEIPRNYHNALKWNLALELCAEFGKIPSALMLMRSGQTYNKIISLNAARRVQPAEIEIAGQGKGYSILID